MNRIEDLTGKTFGELTVIRETMPRISKSGNKSRMWTCKCSCGNIIDVFQGNLLRGYSKSCGCIGKKHRAKSRTSHGLSKTRIYSIWCEMKKRCYKENDPAFRRYGGRGISVCDEWNNSFLSFYKWSMNNGYNDSLTIDRIDNDGNYCPTNCRWASKKEQSRNTSKTIRISIGGETKSLSDWCDALHISSSTVRKRISDGWSEEDALLTPIYEPHGVVRIDKSGGTVEYKSVREAAEKNNITSFAIRAVCQGKNKTSAGYKWKYINNTKGA